MPFEGIASGDAPALIIAEQTGDKRQFVFTGRALPYREVEFAGEQSMELTRYAGNPIRTAQVFGPEEEPTEMGGMWKDKYINNPVGRPAVYTQNGQQVVLLSAFDIVQAVDDMRRKGQELVVQWGPIVRRGLLKRFAHKWLNLHDVTWAMRFEWISQNEADVPAVFAKDTDYANALGTLNGYVQGLQNIIDQAEDMVGTQLSQYTGMVTTLSGLVQQFFDTTSNAIDTTITIIDQQRRIAGILDSIAGSVDDMTDTILATPAELVAVAPAGVPVEGPILSAETTNRQLVSTLRDMKYSALETQQDVLKAIDPDLVAMFVATGNTDLRDVSQEFYDTADEWRSLMVYNNMDDSRLSSGDEVFVPKLLRPLDGSQ